MIIFAGNLSFECTNEDLKKLFEGFGSVVSAVIVMRKEKKAPKSRGFGFVEMPEDEQALAAIAGLNEKEFMGRAMTVMPARPKEESRPKPKPALEPKVRLGNAEYPAEEKEEKRVWSQPIVSKPGTYGGGRRSVSYLKRRSLAGVQESPRPRRRTENNPGRWRKRTDQRKPWQKAPGEQKPWARAEEAGAPRENVKYGSKPRSSASAASQPWKRADEGSRFGKKTEGGHKPWSKTGAASRPWKRAEEAGAPRENVKYGSKPRSSAGAASQPWKRAESGAGTRPWKRAESGAGTRPWKRAEEGSKPWKKTGVEIRTGNKPGGSSVKPLRGHGAGPAGEHKSRSKSGERSPAAARRKPGGHRR